MLKIPAHHSPAAERNAGPILEALREHMPTHGSALEIASGSGQHAAVLAGALPEWRWQPSDWQDDAFASISEWAERAGAGNVLAPVLLDVRSPRWPSHGERFGRDFDLVFCANMLHIAPWECCAGLMRGAATHLRRDGHLFIYGPFLERGVPTTESNASFDEGLRQRDPAWGLRQLDEVLREASIAGLELLLRRDMPAHNLLLKFGHRELAELSEHPLASHTGAPFAT